MIGCCVIAMESFFKKSAIDLRKKSVACCTQNTRVMNGGKIVGWSPKILISCVIPKVDLMATELGPNPDNCFFHQE